jgi:hypothetical protein
MTFKEYGGAVKRRTSDQDRGEERATVGLKLRDVVAKLIAQGQVVTTRALREDYRERIGLKKNKVAGAVADAIDDGFLTNGATVRGGGRALIPGTGPNRPGSDLSGPVTPEVTGPSGPLLGRATQSERENGEPESRRPEVAEGSPSQTGQLPGQFVGATATEGRVP